MKRQFINYLLETVKEIIGETPQLIDSFLIKESMQNKILRLGGVDPKSLRYGFNNLNRRKIIKRKNSDYKFTRSGLKWVNEQLARKAFKDLKINTTKWDGKWRIAIFDIPESKKKQRDTLRARLRDLNFYMLQKSVFVCPYDCQKELGFVAEYLKIKDRLDIILADSLGSREEEVIGYYVL